MTSPNRLLRFQNLTHHLIRIGRAARFLKFPDQVKQLFAFIFNLQSPISNLYTYASYTGRYINDSTYPRKSAGRSVVASFCS